MEQIMITSNDVGHRSAPRFTALAIALGGLLVLAHAAQAAAPAGARFRGTGKADPIRIANIKVAAGSSGQAVVSFDLAWDHSWRAAWDEPEQAHGGSGTLKLESWDAAWVFAKFRKAGSKAWSPATLSAKAADHLAPPAAALDVGLTDDGTKAAGVFAFRAAAGSGPNDWKGVALRWLNEADGVSDPAAAEVKVFAIQMVYVPECAYWLGDGSTALVAAQFSAGDTAAAIRIESEAAITLGGESPRNIGSRDGIGAEYRADDFTSGVEHMLPARFPKGFAAFYCMRNELTEGAFVDYLNHLPAGDELPEKFSHTGQPGWPLPFQTSGDRFNGITVVTPATPEAHAVYMTATPHSPCPGLVRYEHTRYAAWAGLRPMTELEYEKSARGPLRPMADEFVWGTSAIAGSNGGGKPATRPDGYVVTNAGKTDESISWQGADGPDASRGNAVWGGAVRRDGKGSVLADALRLIPNPRAGAFATPDSDRVASGASYWGIMDLSGNLAERVVTVGNVAGRRFAGAHGAWPPAICTVGTRNPRFPEDWGWGFGTRGGSLSSEASTDLRTSDRQAMNNTSYHDPARGRTRQIGVRAVRSARIIPHASKPEERVNVFAAQGAMVGMPASGWDNQCAVVIENIELKPRDAKTATISFDVAWKDSWRNEHSHDAAWVFFKARTGAPAAWRHVKLVADRVVNPSGYDQKQKEDGTKVDLIVPEGADGFTGAFIRRAAPGTGPLNAGRVTFVCDAASVAGLPADGTDGIRGMGIQMVYVPEGPFALGAGGAEVGGFHQFVDGRNTSTPYRVTGPGAIPTGRKQGQLWARNHGGPLVDGGEIPATYPNGHTAFYCMKFQISPAQYADFLNALPPEQAGERFGGTVFNKVVYSGKNGHVSKDDKGRFIGRPGRERAGPGCFGLSWADGATFASWAGLRPMTELELEKAVRGPRDPIADEVGPSYWGISGFGGHDWDAFKGDPQSERPVTATAPGLRFKGTHGLGTTSLPVDWPQADAVGSALRCSHYSSTNLERLRGLVEPPGFFQPTSITFVELPRTRLSDRLFAGVADPERLWSHKWRGVRTAPNGVGP
jgi:hypothetical protein